MTIYCTSKNMHNKRWSEESMRQSCTFSVLVSISGVGEGTEAG